MQCNIVLLWSHDLESDLWMWVSNFGHVIKTSDQLDMIFFFFFFPLLNVVSKKVIHVTTSSICTFGYTCILICVYVYCACMCTHFSRLFFFFFLPHLCVYEYMYLYTHAGWLPHGEWFHVCLYILPLSC